MESVTKESNKNIKKASACAQICGGRSLESERYPEYPGRSTTLSGNMRYGNIPSAIRGLNGFPFGLNSAHVSSIEGDQDSRCLLAAPGVYLPLKRVSSSGYLQDLLLLKVSKAA